MFSEILTKHWDAIVIGSGLGGGSVGRQLAEQGASVLFIERGPANPAQISAQDDPSSDFERGLWQVPVDGTIDGRLQKFHDAFGAGVGGSSTFYAATLERPERSDLDDSPARPHPTGGWPVGYDAYSPYFAEAEKRFFVCGEQDPLSHDLGTLLRPPELPAGDMALIEDFRRHGLHPYRNHMGVRYVPGCTNCLGRACGRNCKMEGRSAGVEPALATGRSALLANCAAIALRGSNNTISHLDVELGGVRHALRAKTYILAAGGFGSPRLLLASRSDQWPDGLANASGLVGRNLMFHLLESVVIWPERRTRISAPSKAITLRDLYWHEGMRLGALQSAGLDALYGEVSYALSTHLTGSALGRLANTLKLNSALARVIYRRRGTGKVFRAIIEDLPYEHNRVVFDPDNPERLQFSYNFSDELRERHRAFRQLLRQRLSGQRTMFLKPKPELDITHACGTLRFGDNPRTSVLNADCRAHDVENLYVADASFFPTSAGINPGLLIAANAIRVADRVLAAMR
ncbi:glucose-methanol-choline oxidoreductase [Devosia limi DSM 17137]|uniref:Choline dehydrogenase n=1 Tax=Devosia limi DSM 17137 TaxID=1121477 RepID=A0A0F5LQL8_9HYPH|nr:GMC family oxidoreductase [Devosia limi]KKB83972.1 glucose-methanol-choline oxidoreductase [Devosia limi DSM 17137]SHE45642.1 Choline dehydrogenase [Devosia limi DSM 17137]